MTPAGPRLAFTSADIGPLRGPRADALDRDSASPGPSGLGYAAEKWLRYRILG
jgi:hypothetical protein